MELITRTINSRPTFVRPHATVLQACEAAGVEIPRFCYHEKLSVAGNCRRCLVEVSKSPKPVVACARPVSKGRIVYTNTPLVRKSREAVLEFLLINHPLDCPICDQGGECDLQDEALNFGADRSRFYEFKRSVEDKECGPIVKTIRTRCIHCTRCVRFSSEVSGQEVLGAFGRGEETEIGTYIQSFLRTELSGNFVDLCPVGALTSKPYAYTARSWELQRTETLDFFDAVCSDITVFTRKRSSAAYKNENALISVNSQEEVLRILPRKNGLYNENWISDRTRYAFDGFKHRRAVRPSVRSLQNVHVSRAWETILQEISGIFANSSVPSFYKKHEIFFNVGQHANLERIYSILAFTKRINFRSGETSLQNGFVSSLNFDAPAFYSLNRTVTSFTDNGNSVIAKIGGILLAGVNPRYEASLLNTTIRREQLRRAFSVSRLNVFTSLRYSNANTIHTGNSFTGLQSLLENRNDVVTAQRIGVSNYLLLQGALFYKNNQSTFFEKQFSLLAKRLFVKTSQYNSFGTIHASVASLAFANIGRGNHKINPVVSENQWSLIFNVDSFQNTKSSYLNKLFPKSTTISYNTHFAENTSGDFVFPTTSLYERSGHFIVLEGRLRKHTKSVSKPKQAFSLETIFSIFARRQNFTFWRRWTESLSFFQEEFPRGALLEQSNIYFTNIFSDSAFSSVEENTHCRGTALPFFTTIRNFYINDQVSTYSSTRGECALFLGHSENFFSER